MTAQPTETPLPRRVYFGAEDRKHLAGKPVQGGGDLHALEIGRRQKLAQTLIQRAEDVANAVKTLRAMDNTGNTENAINHLQATLQDLTKSHGIFVDDVTESIGRYRDRRENEQIIAESTARPSGTMTADQAADLAQLAEATTGPRIPLIEFPGSDRLRVNRERAAGVLPAPAWSGIVAAPKPGPRA